MSICTSRLNSLLWGATLIAGCAITPIWGQDQYPPPQQQNQQYPQQTQQYPQQNQQYPQQNQQYPQQNQQYPQQQQPYPQQYPAQQGQYPSAPPRMAPAQLDQLVGPIALYPDGLLAQVLTGSTFYPQIPDAAGWANQHSYLKGPALANAIQQDRLPWDPAVLALIPFPQVLNYMASNMGWTQALGNEVLAQRGEVMDAVQRERQRAYQYGYLRDNQYERVEAQPNYIEIVPVQPDDYYVPYYDPFIVYNRPRPGFFVGGAIRFGGGITIGTAFAPFGWGGVGFGWREHTILVDRRPWGRSWDNRGAYVHPYEGREHWEGPRQEHHELRGPVHEDRGHEHHDEGHDRR
jgi:uncharacterized protein DUF3300